MSQSTTACGQSPRWCSSAKRSSGPYWPPANGPNHRPHRTIPPRSITITNTSESACTISSPHWGWPHSIDNAFFIFSNKRLVRGEAVEQAGAAGAHQILLAATAAGMGRIPGTVAAAGAIEMAELGGAVAAASPIAAGVVHAVVIGSPVGFRACEDIMRIG